MRRSRNALTFVEVLVVLALVLLLGALLLPATRGSREAARRNMCLSHLKNIGLGHYLHHDDHGHFPPAFTVDNEGRRLNGWRTLTLPYFVEEEQAIYDTVVLDKPWDAVINAKARDTPVALYSCFSTILDPEMTTYLAAVGPHWAFAGATPRTKDEFVDGTANTICVLEAHGERAVPWMSPEDFAEGDKTPFGFETKKGGHPGVVIVNYADGHAAPINVDINPAVLRGMLTIAGGEKSGE
jgi:hypothetical protein